VRDVTTPEWSADASVSDAHVAISEDHASVSDCHTAISEDHTAISEDHASVSNCHTAISEHHAPVRNALQRFAREWRRCAQWRSIRLN